MSMTLEEVHNIINSKDLDKFQDLISHKIDNIDQRFHKEETLLNLCAKANFPAGTQALIDNGANITLGNIINKTALIHAAATGSKEIVEQLLQHKDSQLIVNESTEFHKAPLYYASRNGHTDIVKMLLAREDIKVNMTNCYGETPLSIAEKNEHT